MKKYSFGSDNHSGVHPLIIKAIEKVNNGYCFGYGEDEYTENVLRKIEALLGGNCKALFVLNGTGANVVSLASFLHPFSSILAPEYAHILQDECGAVERFTSCRITPLPSEQGRVTPQEVKKHLEFGDQHKVQPAILSISEPTEFETLYTPAQIKALADLMHRNGGYLHIDGSRISNAVAALGKSLKEIVADSGADVLSLGGTKNGLLIGEIVVVFNLKKNKAIADNLVYIRKQATQLYSKNRFIAAQFEAYFKDNLYIKMAGAANKMAKYFETQLKTMLATLSKGGANTKVKAKAEKIAFTQKVETNAVYLSLASLSDAQIKKLQDKYIFYVWNKETKEVRLMCSYNTTKEAVDSFVSDLKVLITK